MGATKYSDFVLMNRYFNTWYGPKDGLKIAFGTIHLAWPHKMVFVSKFGFSPQWQLIEGPHVIGPAQYYHIPEDLPADAPEVDSQRQRLVTDQSEDFRFRPFVTAAIFWDYRGGMRAVNDLDQKRHHGIAYRQNSRHYCLKEWISRSQRKTHVI